MMKNLLITILMVFAMQFAFSQAYVTHMAPPFNNSTSSSRTPNGTSAHAYFRGMSIIPAAELTTGIPTSTSIKKFGFMYNSGASSAVTGTLKIFMMNTTDATFLHSTIWDTIVAHSILVYNGSYTIPTSTGIISQDISLATPFTYGGNGMYVAYEWYSAGPYATTGATAQSNTTITSGVKMASSTTGQPSNISTASNWRPVMRFHFDNPNTTDASVLQVYTYGKMPIPAGNPHQVKANLLNQGSDTLYDLKAYLHITGANTFIDSLNLDTLLPGDNKFVSFTNFMATNTGINAVTVSLPNDQNNTNNTMTKQLETNTNSFNFSQGNTADGSAGFNSATGDFVAKFSTSTQQGLNQVDVNFASGGNQFKIGIWSVAADGKPDTLTYESITYTSSAGIYTVLINPPVILPAGSFFVGVKQTGTTNVGFQYQTETPIRPNTFFYASPTGSTSWVDFAPNTSFRFMIEPKFALSNDVGVNAVIPASTTTLYAGQTINLRAIVANYGISSQSNIPVSYSINGGTPKGPIVIAGTLGSNDTASVIFTGANAFIPAVAGNYSIKVFTQMLGDEAIGNDTLTFTYTILPSAITNFPYVQNFDSAAGWTISGASNFWIYDSAYAAVGSQTSPNPAVYAAFYNHSSGTKASLNSPVLNISGLTNPILRFHVAYRTYNTEDDSLQILVSNDYGTTFLSGSPALYLKSNSSNPSLATMTPSNTEYIPSDSTEWRLETVDLSQFSTSQNLIISFKGHSQYGNNCWIDNVVVKSATTPTLSTQAATNIGTTIFTTGGNIIDDGGKNIIRRGICWSTSANPTITNDTTINGSGNGAFNTTIIGLTPGTTYYARAYATNSIGTAYGNELQIMTTPVVAPTISTVIASSITVNSAISGGNISSTGGDSLTAKGVCWSTSPNPTLSNTHSNEGTMFSNFIVNITGLAANTTYYVRAYASNSVDTGYGNEISFTTLSNATIATLQTITPSSIDYTTAVSGGNITSDGGAAITSRGLCWSTTANPTTANDTTISGLGTGVFSSSVSSLTPGTTYYIRAYAINSVGTAYGNELIFNTTTPTIPTINLDSVATITINSAQAHAEAIAENGASIIAKGVCWSSSPNPSLSDNFTTDGNGLGVFSSNLSNLNHSTTYYVKAYATNSVGTNYSAEMSFTTLVDGIDEMDNARKITIISSDMIIKISSSTNLPKGQIQLIDLSGKLINQLESNGFNTSYEISTNQLAKGIYLIRLELDEVNYTQKITIQ